MRKMIIGSALSTAALFAVVSEGGATEADDSTVAANAAIKPVENLDQLDNLKKAMKDRQTFESFEKAFAALTKAAEATDNFYGLPIQIVGYDSTTETVDESIYEGSAAVLAYVGARNIKFGKGKDEVTRNSVKSVVVFPVPTLETFLASSNVADDATDEAKLAAKAVRTWLEKIMIKEASHVAFRNFRDANTTADLANGAAAAPRTIQDYVTASEREGNGLDTDTFDALWNSFRNALKKNQPVIYDLLPGKAEVLKAIRSKAYAMSIDELEPLESKGIFAKIAAGLIAGAKSNKDKDGAAAPLDTTALESWLAERDTLVLTKEAPKAKDFSALDNLEW